MGVVIEFIAAYTCVRTRQRREFPVETNTCICTLLKNKSGFGIVCDSITYQGFFSYAPGPDWDFRQRSQKTWSLNLYLLSRGSKCLICCMVSKSSCEYGIQGTTQGIKKSIKTHITSSAKEGNNPPAAGNLFPNTTYSCKKICGGSEKKSRAKDSVNLLCIV